ncbi:transposase [Candidatus Thiothrix phosphatis]|uniref:transposase n=1 Tax=Candidatus Thiothrix phosphatis TaxID=3112415 RepID=UPI0035C8D407
MTERHPYPSDISREPFEAIGCHLESFRRRTKPRTHDLYDVVCGVLYVLKTGSQWRALPHDFPPHHTVHTTFRQWAAKPHADQPSLLETVLDGLVAAEREADGRAKKPPC